VTDSSRPAPPYDVVVPEGYTFSAMGSCRSCGARIAWTTSPAGRPAPLDPDGVSHFATCPQASDWRGRPAGPR